MTKRTCNCKTGVTRIKDCDNLHEVDWFGAKFAATIEPEIVEKKKEMETQTPPFMLKRSKSTQTMLNVPK